MTQNKYLHFFLTLGIVFFMFLVSDFAGAFVAGKDARTGQVVVLISILLGMVMYYVAEFLSKKIPEI